MRRIKRLNRYNLHLEEIKSKNYSKFIESSHYKEVSQTKGLNYIIGYDDLALADENECIDTHIFVKAFANEALNGPKTISELYNHLRFRHYMDSDNVRNFRVIESCKILLEDLPEAINFSDISSDIKSFLVNK